MQAGSLIDLTLAQASLEGLPVSAREELRAQISALGVYVESRDEPAQDAPVKLYISHTADLLDETTCSQILNPEVTKASRVRVFGLADAMVSDWQAAFECLRSTCSGTVELCPSDKWGCATGIVMEWLCGGYGNGCSSLFGEGTLAATEQVVAALIATLHGRNLTLEGLASLRSIWESLGIRPVAAHAPVAGREIYYVESGVHVDGILKDPTNYEPLPPEALGAQRAIILGKHSGRASIVYELNRLGVSDASDKLVRHLLACVREEAAKSSGVISQSRFRELVCQEITL